MCNLSEYLNDNELKNLGRYALLVVRNVYPKRRTKEGTFTVDINAVYMKKMIQLINSIEWFSIEMSPNDSQSIPEILERLDNQRPLISESYLKSLVDEET
jgi:hypothetical protein